MKVELDIRDDKELRNLIKDMIRGQIKNVAREEVKEIVMAEMVKKTSRNVETLFIEAVTNEVRRQFLSLTSPLRVAALYQVEKCVPANVESTLAKINFEEKVEQLLKSELKKQASKILAGLEVAL